MTTDTQTEPTTLTDEQQQVIHNAADIIAPVFEANGWMYFWTKPEVPSRDKLVSTITALVEAAVADEDLVETSTGRITVLRQNNPEDDDFFTIEIKLDLGSFIVEDA